MLNYGEAGVVRNSKLEEGGVGIGKMENMETVVISPDEQEILATDSFNMRFWRLAGGENSI